MNLPRIIANHLSDNFDRVLILFVLIAGVGFGLYHFNVVNTLKTQISQALSGSSDIGKQLEEVKKELDELKSQDQIKINQDLKTTIKNIEDTYNKAVVIYEDLLELKPKVKSTEKLDAQFAKSLKLLSDKNYSSASSELTDLEKKIKEEDSKIVTSFKIPENVKTSNSPPSGSAYSSQSVQTESGTFLVNIISADLGSNKVIIDTASDSDCSNECPVLALGEYVSRSGAWAGINGAFFCPASYPSCAGKTNSYDTLLMNKNKKYFNSDNNVYSTVPAAIFSAGSARFVSQSLEWGRDTNVDGVIASHPLYVQGGNVAFGGSGDPKIDSKGTRTFIAHKAATAYIGLVFNASGADTAKVLKTLGMDSAIGLDQGGSTALWYGGYKAGPGRAIPTAVLFVKR